MKRVIIFFTLFAFFNSAYAHEIRPAYLQIQEQEENVYEAFWKIPSLGDAIPKLEIIFPGSPLIEELNLPRLSDGFMVFNYQLTYKESIEGKPLRIDGLAKTLIDVLVRIEYLNGEQVTFLLQPDNVSEIIPGKSTPVQVIKTYTTLGIEHILFGFDHLLFVLALIIIAKGKWKIIKTITAFTLAHSITLSLAALGYVDFPTAPIEAVIALSIVFLALEIVKNSKGEETLTARKPWLVAFIFGLLHGLGFAGALTNIGLPQLDIPLALAFFNVGVEFGQLAFVFVTLGLLYLVGKTQLSVKWGKQFAAYAIGSIAVFWMIERIAVF